PPPPPVAQAAAFTRAAAECLEFRGVPVRSAVAADPARPTVLPGPRRPGGAGSEDRRVGTEGRPGG
ncbi:hypothetical protein, partial [Mycobacterium tuberculosis]|uniref:hypothetical protein n=1 Tax=Mycobacterium tuberculosis TaxID=1773 RepID=UPI001BE4BB93